MQCNLGEEFSFLALGCMKSVMALLGKPKSHLPYGEWSVSTYASYWAWISPIKIQWTSLFSLLFMKARPKQWPNFKGYSNVQSCNLFISWHLHCPMKRVIEAHEKCGHFEKSSFGSSLECSLLLGLLVGFVVEIHMGHGLGLEHDVDLEGLHHECNRYVWKLINHNKWIIISI